MMASMMRIGAVARATGEPVRTIRFWHDAGLLPARRTDAGYRTFAPEAVERARFVRRVQALGFSLSEIRDVLRLRDDGVAPCDHVRERLESHHASVRRRIEALQELERDLAARIGRARSDPSPACDEGCVYLDEA
jgi:DNA-binding transcriptional MerR regulator